MPDLSDYTGGDTHEDVLDSESTNPDAPRTQYVQSLAGYLDGQDQPRKINVPASIAPTPSQTQGPRANSWLDRNLDEDSAGALRVAKESIQNAGHDYLFGEDVPESKLNENRQKIVNGKFVTPTVISSADAVAREAAMVTQQLLAKKGQEAYADRPTDEQAAKETMVLNARQTIAQGGPPDQIEAAKMVLKDHLTAQSDSINRTEQNRASASLGPADYMKRVVELKQRGFDDHAVAQIMAAGQWDSKDITPEALDHLEGQIDLLNSTGQFDRARNLRSAKVAMLKQGLGSIDTNITPADVMYDAAVRYQGQTASWWDAFSLHGVNAMQSSTNAIRRLIGVLPPQSQEKTTIEQLADATEDNHKWAGMAGDFAGGFVDPIFFALNAVTGGVGGKAVSATAKSARLTELLGKGVLPAIAEKEATSMTLESWAQNSISKWLERKGIQTPAVNSALTRILWNQASAAPIMAGQSALVASAEPTMSPAEKGLAVARGTGQGVLMGFALSGLHIGLESGVSGTRKLAMSIMGRSHPDLPAPVSKAFENALDYAQNGMHADSVKVDLEKSVQALADAKSALKRPLSGGEVEQVLDAHGINLDHFRNLKPETNDTLIQAGAQIEHRLNDPTANLKSEERAALTDQHEKIQDMLKRRGELPEQVKIPAETMTPEEAHAGGAGADGGQTTAPEGRTGGDDSALLGRLREMDQVASQSGRMPPELAAEHRQFLGEVASRGLSSEYRVQAAKASEGSPSTFQSQKWASTRESLLRDAGRRAEGTDKLTPTPEGAPNVESAAKVVSKDEIMAQVRKDHPDSADAVESIIGMHKGDFVLANVHSSKFKVDLPTGDAKTEGINKGNLAKYSKMSGESAPPVVAITDPNAPGKLFIADGRHRVLASMLRERQGKGDGSVMAYVPKEWAESSAEPAKAPPQTPRLSPSGSTIPHPSVRPTVMELGSEEIAGGGYKPEGKPFSSRRLAEAKAEVLNKAGADAVISKDGDYWKVHTRENAPAAVELRTEKELARTDELTGLGNRVKEREDIDRIYAEADKRGEHVGVVETDLANMKVVNDQLGHDMGDKILQAEGQSIQEAIRMEAKRRPSDYAGLTEAGTVNRVGGDEFPIKLRNIDDPAQADEIMQRVNEVFKKKVEAIIGDRLPKEAHPFIAWGTEIRKPNDTRSPKELAKTADAKVIPNKQAMKAKLGIPETREELTGFIERRKASNVTPIVAEPQNATSNATPPTTTEVPRGTENPRSAKGKRSSEASPAPAVEPVKGQGLKLDLPGRNFPLEGHYAVVSARDAIPSHDARAGFEPNAFGDLNERDYRDPTEGKALRENIFRMRDRLNPSLLHTDTPSAVDGPPIVDQSLRALGGNARTMLQQLVYHEGGEKADFLKSTVRQAAKKFGIDPTDIAHIDDPMIVRMIKQEHAGEPGELSRLLNQSFTAAKTSDTEAVSRGRKITQAAGAKIASLLPNDVNLGEVLNNRKTSDTLLGHLVETGAMNRDDLIGLTDQRGLLNQQGRKVVENLMLGSAIPDIRRLVETPPQLRGTLIKSIPAILKLRANPIEGSPKFDTTLGNALDALKEYRDSGAGSLHDMVEQQSMLPQPWRKDTNALGLAEAMLEDTPSKFVAKLDQLANQSVDVNSGQMGLGGNPIGPMTLPPIESRSVESIASAVRKQLIDRGWDVRIKRTGITGEGSTYLNIEDPNSSSAYKIRIADHSQTTNIGSYNEPDENLVFNDKTGEINGWDEFSNGDWSTKKSSSMESIFPYSGPPPAESGAMFGGSMADMGRARRGTSYDGGSSPYVPTVKVSGNASEHFRDAINPVPMPELVKLARALGVDPTITSLAKKGERGAFGFGPNGTTIKIDPGTALEPDGLAKTLAHEIGHLVDYLDDKTMGRGNVLGRVASLKPILTNLRTMHGFMQNTFPLAKATNAELRKELVDLSQFWKPFNKATSTPEYIQYRNSPQELYADAMSVFLNSPGLLEQKAPKFYAEFSRFIDQKPTVKKAILDIQDLLAGKTEDVIAVRRADSREDYATADQIWKIRAQEARVGSQNVVEWAEQMFHDRAAPIINREKAAALKGIPAAERQTAAIALDEYNHKNNATRSFYSEIQREFHEPIINDGIASRDEVGDYLKFQRIANGDRKAFGNSGGHTPETAQQMLDDQARIMGPEKWSRLQAGVQTLHDKYNALVERAVEEGVYSSKVLEESDVVSRAAGEGPKMGDNKGFYVPFAVIDHLENHVGYQIMNQVGTFKGIANPYDALLMKAHSLIRATELNRAKRIAIHDGIMEWFPGEVTLHQPAPGMEPPKAKAGFEHLPYMVDGRKAYLEVDAHIADAFKSSDIGKLNRLTGLISSSTYGTLHPFYVTYSMAFAQANVLRDFKRTYVNLSSALGEKVTMGEMLSAYWKNRDVAWRRATERYDPLVEQMFKERALGVRWSDYAPTDELVGAEKLFQQAGLSEKKDFLNRLGEIFKPAEQALRIADWPLKKMRQAVDFTEALPKISAYTILAEKGIDPQRRAYIIRNFVGTPNTARRGLATNLTNALFMYSNVAIQGLATDLRLATNPKTASGWWLRSMFTDFMPKMLMRAATLGAFGAGLKSLYDMVPDYDMAKFTVIPLGTVTGDDGKERVRYVRIPHEDTHRLLASVTWKLSEGQPAAAFSELVGQLPFNPNPYLSMGSKWLQYWQGQNPTDDFRNRPIIEANAFKAGGIPALAGMAHWTANQFGTISTIYNSFQGEPGNPRQTSTSERIIGSAQAISGVSAWLKTSDRGMSEKKWADVDVQEAEKARFKLGLPENTKALLMDRYRLNRLLGAEKKDFTPSDRQRLGVLNQWYSDVYLPVTKQMKVLQEAKRTADFEKTKANLQTMTDQALQRSRAKPAPIPSNQPGRN